MVGQPLWVGLVMETRGGHDAMPACERCETAAREAVAGERKPGPIIEWRNVLRTRQFR